MLRKVTAIFIVFAFMTTWMLHPAAATVEQGLQGRVVVLDAGHGLDYTNVYEGYDEQVAMLALAKKIKPHLEARGAKVLMTRETEEEIPLAVRVAMINKWALQAAKELGQGDPREIDRLLRIVQSVIDDPETNAPVYTNTPFDYTYTREAHPDWQRVFEYEGDPGIGSRFLVVSLHSNATTKPIDTSKNGVEVFYVSNSTKNNKNYYSNYSHEDRSLYFGELILGSIGRLGIEKRAVKDYYYMMIREHNLPCVLVENGFHTNSGDREKLMDDSFLDRLALIYADTISFYFATFKALPAPLDDVFG
ncbi:MAG: N-acetylmuramoyl-L-alanine amidase [Clostridiales bacterium]|nr:N-acetylmuramoyl-L-alanine amidase [Clostridiales bacterium]